MRYTLYAIDVLHLFLGTDSVKARKALQTAAEKTGGQIVRITDASSLDDLRSALAGGGMFAAKQTIIFDRVSDNQDLWQMLIGAIERLAQTDDAFFLYEEKVDAATKRLLQKHAAKVEAFDAPKAGKERPTIFTLVNYLRAGDKKNLWVAYQQELASGNAGEAIHGVLFWGVKQMLTQARSPKESARAKHFLIALTELPHEARRRAEELEYALERFILSIA